MTTPLELKARGSYSTYLDLLRFTAAMLVVLEHAVILQVLPDLGVVTSLSHESVVVFFVLSGLVIGATTSPATTLREYVATRSARIYSVALPALVTCYLVYALAGTANPGDAPIGARFLSSLLFLDGVWVNYAEVPFNGPYWSLCYEAWYYALWAVLLFARHRVLRMLLAGMLLMAMGPAIAPLAGIWLLGAVIATRGAPAAAYLERVPRWVSAGVFALSLLAVIAGAASGVQDDVRQWIASQVPAWWRLRGSVYALTDYVIGVLVAVHLLAAWCVFGRGRTVHDSELGRAIRYCAGFTFTLYLFHYPLLLVVRAVGLPPEPALASGCAALAVVLAGVWVTSFATERQLPGWRRMTRLVIAWAFPIGRAATAPRVLRRTRIAHD